MSDNFFLPVIVSNPKSGLALLMDVPDAERMKSWYKTGSTVHLAVLSAKCSEDGVALIRFSVGDSHLEHGRAWNRLQDDRLHPAYACRWHGKPSGPSLDQLPQFGQMSAKLYMYREDGRPLAHIELDTRVIRPPVTRSRNHAPSSEVVHPRPPAPPPTVPKVLILLSIAGQDLEFNVPMEEAFALTLNWTQKGYKS